jgi:putative ABC transport system ATP-binding protein
MSSQLLEARALGRTYVRGSEQVHAVDGVSLSVGAEQLVGLVGASGSGKTTLLNLLAGWEQPDTGELLWDGRGASSLDRRQWNDIAIVPQTLGLLEELSIRENIDLPRRLGACKEVDQGRVGALLDELGLGQFQDRVPAEVSLGEQQRTAVARALVCRPRLLLADEPTGHQDAAWARGVFRSLRAACAEGTTCLVATHNAEILKFFDRIIEIADGRTLNGISESVLDPAHRPHLARGDPEL